MIHEKPQGELMRQSIRPEITPLPYGKHLAGQQKEEDFSGNWSYIS
ncbi:MAG: hypothetical protein ACE5K3_00395 [bacterium]